MKQELANVKTKEDLIKFIERLTENEAAELRKMMQEKPESHVEFLTTAEVAELLRISRVSVWKYSQQGILHPILLGSKRLFARSSIDNFINSQN